MSVQRRHVCVVTETYPPEINGVASTLAQLVTGMRARGHTVSLVRPRQPSVDPRGRGRDPETMLVAGMRLPGYGGARIGLPAGVALRAAWGRRRPDAAYVATEGPLGWSAVRASAALGISAYGGFHTNFQSYVQHYRAGWLRHPIAAYLRRFHNATAGTFVATVHLRDELAAAGFRNLTPRDSLSGVPALGSRAWPSGSRSAVRRYAEPQVFLSSLGGLTSPCRRGQRAGRT